MAIQQTKRQSDLEKRLQVLRRQVYGKSSEKPGKPKKSENQMSSNIQNFRYSSSSILQSSPGHSESFRTDQTYLYHDLVKILIFSSLAIGSQIILFILLRNNILKFNFF